MYTHTALEIKRMMINYQEIQVPESSLAYDISPQNLLDASSLDPSALNSTSLGGPIFSGQDLADALLRGINEYNAEGDLKRRISPALTDPTRKAEVRRLLDEDLMELGREDVLGNDRALISKAQCIAGEHAKKNIIRTRKQPSPPGTLKGSNYSIQLLTLANGHGGNTVQLRLYFNYLQSFHGFLQALKEETKLSKIPPQDLTLPALTPQGWSPAPGEPGSASISNTTGSQSGSTRRSSLFSLASLASKTTSKPRDRTDKGYTLNDGPWIYRIRDGKSPWGSCRELKDQSSYIDMIDEIKKAKDCFAVIIHSVDNTAREQWDEIVKEKAIEEQRFIESCKDMDPFDDSDDDKSGVPFASALMKGLQEEARQSRGRK